MIADADLTVLHIGFGGRPGEQTDLTCDRNPTCNLTMYPNQTRMLETVLAHIDSHPKSKLILVLFTTLPMNITALVSDPRVSAIVPSPDITDIIQILQFAPVFGSIDDMCIVRT